nr:prepro-urotensin II-beta isoform X1 [Danio rerio]|eukprot:XP_021335250.1 prepro-urotensin II-beta isoform X1 [Danio rerio]
MMWKLLLLFALLLTVLEPLLGHPVVQSAEMSFGRPGLRTAGFVPSQAVKEALLEKPLWSRFLGSRKQYHKRGSNTECFWKYCV